MKLINTFIFTIACVFACNLIQAYYATKANLSGNTRPQNAFKFFGITFYQIGLIKPVNDLARIFIIILVADNKISQFLEFDL